MFGTRPFLLFLGSAFGREAPSGAAQRPSVTPSASLPNLIMQVIIASCWFILGFLSMFVLAAWVFG